LTRVVYWPDVSRDVRARISSCPECAVVKGRVFKPALQVKQIEAGPFECYAIDHAGPFPRTVGGKRYLLVVVDVFSGYPEAFALSNLTAKATAEALFAHFGRFGWPRTILSDNGTAFKNELIREMCKITRVRHTFTTVRNPQANGSAERLIGTIKRALETLQAKYTTDWERKVQMVLLAIRQTPRAPLWLSPSQIVFGHQIKGPLERELSWEPIELTPVQDWVFQRLKAYRETRIELKEALLDQRIIRSERSDTGKYVTLREGDLVLVFNPTALISQTHGIRQKWRGPFVVHRKTSAVNYSIYEDGELKTYHLSRLLPYDPRGVSELGHIRERISELRKEYSLFLKKILAEVTLSKKTHVRETADEHMKRLQQVSDHMGREWKFLGQPRNFSWERNMMEPSSTATGSEVSSQPDKGNDRVQTKQDTGRDGHPTLPPLHLTPPRDDPPTSSYEHETVEPPLRPGQPIEEKSPHSPTQISVNEPKESKQEPVSSDSIPEGVNDKITQTRKAASELESQPRAKRNKHLVSEIPTQESTVGKPLFGIVIHRGIHFLGEDLGGLVHLYSCGGRNNGVFVPRYLGPDGELIRLGPKTNVVFVPDEVSKVKLPVVIPFSFALLRKKLPKEIVGQLADLHITLA